MSLAVANNASRNIKLSDPAYGRNRAAGVSSKPEYSSGKQPIFAPDTRV